MACEMLIAVDEPLYAHLGRRMDNVTELVNDMMGRLNNIYHRTFLRYNAAALYQTLLTGMLHLGRLVFQVPSFVDYRPDTDFGEIYFHAKEVRILFDFCTECNHTQQVTDNS